LVVAVTLKDQDRLTQRFYANTFLGQRVGFSGYIKTNRVLEQAGLWVRMFPVSQKWTASD
jgi:hypothetical protein